MIGCLRPSRRFPYPHLMGAPSPASIHSPNLSKSAAAEVLTPSPEGDAVISRRMRCRPTHKRKISQGVWRAARMPMHLCASTARGARRPRPKYPAAKARSSRSAKPAITVAHNHFQVLQSGAPGRPGRHAARETQACPDQQLLPLQSSVRHSVIHGRDGMPACFGQHLCQHIIRVDLSWFFCGAIPLSSQACSPKP